VRFAPPRFAPLRREALKGCAAGDVLLVWKLDRLARSLHDLVVIAEDLKGRDVGLKILTGEGAAVDTTRPQGRMIFGILAGMAEFEREMISERTVAGMKAAKRRGRHVGRPRKLTVEQLSLARQLLDSDLETPTTVAEMLKVGKSTLRRRLNASAGSGGTVAGGKRPASVRAGKQTGS
jgi:DNA invertase Pin-like site-specific DNA recombinase